MHSILSFTHEDYGRATSLSNLASQIHWGSSGKTYSSDDYVVLPPVGYSEGDSSALPGHLQSRRANATLLMLARNSDVNDAIKSVRRMEDRYNRRAGYPWVFLNEEPFSEEFKTCVSIYLLVYAHSPPFEALLARCACRTPCMLSACAVCDVSYSPSHQRRAPPGQCLDAVFSHTGVPQRLCLIVRARFVPLDSSVACARRHSASESGVVWVESETATLDVLFCSNLDPRARRRGCAMLEHCGR